MCKWTLHFTLSIPKVRGGLYAGEEWCKEMKRHGSGPYLAGKDYVDEWEYEEGRYDNFPNEDDAMRHGNASFTIAAAAMVKQVRIFFQEEVWTDPRVRILPTIQRSRYTQYKAGTVRNWGCHIA